jgi:ATP-binding cassette, subfamily F, member 3
MLQIQKLSKFFGERRLFEDASLVLNSGERVALFGRNGSGKSTLFKMILGLESPDSGEITTPRNYQIGYLEQHLKFTEKTAIDEACLVFGEERDTQRYRAEIMLAGLGFSDEMCERSPQELSGGYQIRVNLAKLLLSEPNLLLLDEPTNYLDIVSLRWLAKFLRGWQGEIILISHDRSFCDSVSTHSALVYRGGLRKILGQSDKLYTQIAQDEELYERTRQNQAKELAKMEAFINRFRAKASKATVVQSRIKAYEKIDKLSELDQEDELDFKFTYAPFPGKFLAEVEEISFGYDGGPLLIQDLSFSVKPRDRIGVIGKNGRGKSTLLGLLAGEHSVASGTFATSANARVSYFGQTNVQRLKLDSTVEDEIRTANSNLSRTQVRSICGAMMFEGDDALKKLSVLSGGERSRVLLGRILATPSNLLLLDEPSNHLDMESVEALIDAIDNFAGAVVVVTHDEGMLRTVASRLIVFQGDIPFLFEGTYDEFLARIGWDDEQDSTPKRPQTPTSKNSPDEERKQRARRQQERSKAIAPVKKRLESVEQRIAALEREIGELQSQLATPSSGKSGELFAQWSKSLAVKQGELNEKMKDWEDLSLEMTNLEQKFTGGE